MLRQTDGIALDVVTAEYAVLRCVTIEELRKLRSTPDNEDVEIRFNVGFDLAIGQAVQRYTQAREEVRERFIGILAHDLRDPLAAVSLSASMLGGTRLDENQARLVARISCATERIDRMVNDVLDFARGRLDGGITLTLEPTDMGVICAGVAEEQFAGRNVEIEVRVDGDLRGIWDGERVKQALANLVGNALQHGDGKVVLNAWEAEDRETVFTSVTNVGPTIPTEQLTRLFDPFARPANARGPGLGLGLYIVQHIALAHGGVCRVTSSEESGTTFTISWPRVPLEQTPGRLR